MKNKGFFVCGERKDKSAFSFLLTVWVCVPKKEKSLGLGEGHTAEGMDLQLVSLMSQQHSQFVASTQFFFPVPKV